MATTKGPFDDAFWQHLIDHGIFTANYIYAGGTRPPGPSNMDAILDMLEAPSPLSTLPSGADYDAFVRANALAASENDVMRNDVPLIEGNVSVADARCANGKVRFTNLNHLTDGTLVACQPDLYHGTQPDQLHLAVRNILGNHVIPSSKPHLPATPNFFLEVKGPYEFLQVATLQACYAGCLGARGMESLRSLARPAPTYEAKAYTIVSTCQNGMLIMYSIHAIPSPGGRIEYVMTQLGGWCLIGNAREFQRGVLAYRNAREWARQQREEAIAMANETVNWNMGEAS